LREGGILGFIGSLTYISYFLSGIAATAEALQSNRVSKTSPKGRRAMDNTMVDGKPPVASKKNFGGSGARKMDGSNRYN